MTGSFETAHVAHLLPAYVAGTLDDGDRGHAAAHLVGCPACRAELAAWRVVQQATREVFPEAVPTDDDALQQVWRRIDAAGERRQPLPLRAEPTVKTGTVPAASAPRRFFLEPFVRRPLAHLATAALIALTLAGSFLLFGPGRSWRLEEVPAILPAISGTPATPATVVTETLIDATAADLPEERLRVAVDRWTLQPSPSEVTLPAFEELVMLTVDAGEIEVTVAGDEHLLAAGDALDVTNHEFAFRASGSTEAIAYVTHVTSRFSAEFGTGADHIWQSGDPLVHAVDFIISSSSDDFPGGPGRLILERLTIPPGGALSPRKTGSDSWTEIGSGALGLTLEGDRLPFRWKSGQERTFRYGQRLPFLPGTHMTLRNAGDDPLVLYRLTLIPGEAGSSGDAASPKATPRPP